MAHEPEPDNLEDILTALRHEQITVREQAMKRLQVYANSTGSATENDAPTEAELETAVYLGDIPTVRDLLDHHVEVNLKRPDGMTIFSWITSCPAQARPTIVHMLNAAGAKQ